MVHSVLRDCCLSTFIFNLHFQLSAVWDLASEVNLGEFSLLIKEADLPILQTNSLQSINILILEFGNMLFKHSSCIRHPSMLLISPHIIVLCSTVKSSQFWIADIMMVGAVNLAESRTRWEVDL